jgi:hypothetical protein
MKPILLLRHVRNVGARRGDVAAGQTVDDARREEHQQALGDSQHREAHRGADQAVDEHRPPAVAIRQLPQQRGGDELAD